MKENAAQLETARMMVRTREALLGQLRAAGASDELLALLKAERDHYERECQRLYANRHQCNLVPYLP